MGRLCRSQPPLACAHFTCMHGHTHTWDMGHGFVACAIVAVNCATEIHGAHRRHPGPDDRAEAHGAAGVRRAAASA